MNSRPRGKCRDLRGPRAGACFFLDSGKFACVRCLDLFREQIHTPHICEGGPPLAGRRPDFVQCAVPRSPDPFPGTGSSY
eukprot:3125042-Pyramimonas_sp.AAC.1